MDFDHTDLVYDIAKEGSNLGIWHVSDASKSANGRLIRTNNQQLVNFGSCSYLGLDFDPRLIEAIQKATKDFGTQMSSSRSYVSSGLYNELEDLLQEIFGYPVVVTASTTLGHLSAIPVLVNLDSVVILDQSVHASVQQAVKLVKADGVKVEIVRHNNIDQLEEKILQLRQKYKQIWYMADGIYSMYGSLCDIDKIYPLLDKYPELHLYIDDAHGLSWTGAHGSGYILSKVKMHPRLVLTFSMHKAFGAVGGIILCYNNEMAERIKYCGNTMIFSGPINPPMLAAAIASAKIHLSDEIYELQNNLRQKVQYVNSLAKSYDLPFPFENDSPIVFVGVGRQSIGYNISKRLINDGYFTNLAIFPAVPAKNTGIRICVTNHQTKEDYNGLMSALNYHLPIAIESDNWTRNKINRSFNLPQVKEDILLAEQKGYSEFKIEVFNDINEVPRRTWNMLFDKHTSCSWDLLQFLQMTFNKNKEVQDNWEFYYFIVKDKKDEIVLATHFTRALWKEDMLSSLETSREAERKRKHDNYYLTSYVLSIGSILSEGKQLYVNNSHPKVDKALQNLIETLYEYQEQTNSAALVWRDFEKTSQIGSIFKDKGFHALKSPVNHVLDISNFNSIEEYYQGLSKNSKKHVRKYILKYENVFRVEVVKNADQLNVENWFRLYMNVKMKSLELNTFDLPLKFFHKVSNRTDLWDIIELHIKQKSGPEKPVAVLFSIKTENSYCPTVLGIDYSKNEEYNIYRQIHYQAIKRAIQLGKKEVRLGFTASIEKIRLGATKVESLLFAEYQDNFSFMVLST